MFLLETWKEFSEKQSFNRLLKFKMNQIDSMAIYVPEQTMRFSEGNLR